ncbi:hypothetical protein pipiens_019670 [Culex pipiens pipiens]|uniref:Secreted protein n=1 Tax=Culex pipiens pipiens TaxID=38569 RepID=A0ABD1DT76_CULPP
MTWCRICFGFPFLVLCAAYCDREFVERFCGVSIPGKIKALLSKEEVVKLIFDFFLVLIEIVWEPPETYKDVTKISSTQREVEAEPASNDTAIHSSWKRLIAHTLI